MPGSEQHGSSTGRPEPQPLPAQPLSARALSGLNWAFLTAGSQAGLSLAITMTLARLLTPEHFGQLAIALVFLTLADTAVRRGLGPALVQRLHLSRHHLSTGFALSLGGGLLFAALLFGIAPRLANLIGEPGIAPILGALSLAVALTGAGVVSEHVLRRELRFRALMVAAVVSQGVSGVASVALAALGYGVWALVVGSLVRQAVFSAVVIVCAPPPNPLRARASAAADLLRTGVGFSLIALLNVLSARGIHLVIAAVLGAAQLGLYTRARSLADAPTRIAPALRDVLMPAMARRQTATGRLRSVHAKGSEILSLAVLPFGMFLIVAAPEIVAVILGEQWAGAVPVLRVLAFAGIAQTISAVQVPVLRALGAVYRETWRRAAYLFLLLGSVWVAGRWGLVAAAAAICGAQVLLFAVLVKLVLALLGTGWRGYLLRQLPALWTALAAGAALWVASGLVRAAGLAPVAALAAQLLAWSLAAAAAVYLAPSWVRPTFAGWALGRLPLETLGPIGTLAHAVLAPLAARASAPAADPAPSAGELRTRRP